MFFILCGYVVKAKIRSLGYFISIFDCLRFPFKNFYFPNFKNSYYHKLFYIFLIFIENSNTRPMKIFHYPIISQCAQSKSMKGSKLNFTVLVKYFIICFLIHPIRLHVKIKIYEDFEE